MAAVVEIHEMTGTASGVDKTSGTVRFKSAIETTVDGNNRIQIPVAGDTYSYTKQLKFYVASGTYTDIQNLRAYSDGANNFGTGVACKYDTTNTYGTNFNTNLGGADVFTKTSGAPVDLDTTNAGPHTGTGYKGDVLRLQLTVSSTASSGTLTAETLTFAYDET